MSDKIQNAYESSKNIYDDVLTQGNIFSKLYIKLFWSGTNDNDIAQKVLSYIPNDFSGKLATFLEMPFSYLEKHEIHSWKPQYHRIQHSFLNWIHPPEYI